MRCCTMCIVFLRGPVSVKKDLMLPGLGEEDSTLTYHARNYLSMASQLHQTLSNDRWAKGPSCPEQCLGSRTSPTDIHVTPADWHEVVPAKMEILEGWLARSMPPLTIRECISNVSIGIYSVSLPSSVPCADGLDGSAIY